MSQKGLRFITTSIINACKAYTPLNDKVDELYAKPLTYVVGVLKERTEEGYEYEYRDVPQITIDPIGRTFSDEDEKKDYGLGLKVIIQHPKAIFEAYIKKTDDVIEHRGVLEVVELFELINEALKASDELKCFLFKDIEETTPVIEWVSRNIEYWGQVKLVFSNDNEDYVIGGCNS